MNLAKGDGDADRQKERVRNQFGISASDYATSEVHARGESLLAMVKRVQPQSDWHALDVATGAGHTAAIFAPFVEKVIATDITEEMLRATAKTMGSLGLTNVTTEPADAESLPFEDGSFDLVTCRLAFHHFSAPLKALEEFHRVLKPGGRLALSDNYCTDDVSDARFYNEFEKLRDPSHVEVYSLPRLEAMLQDAHFSISSVEKFEKEFDFEPWAERQRVSETNKRVLKQMLNQTPSGLLEWLKPKVAKDKHYFTLHEVVLIGLRGAA